MSGDYNENIEIYKVWAPENARYSAWAKPVAFMDMNPALRTREYGVKSVQWIEDLFIELDSRTMVILDLPSDKGIDQAIKLAESGHRPVPLFNGVTGQGSKNIVDNTAILKALYNYTEILRSFTIDENAPPVFILDSNRLEGPIKKRGTFDNRWSVFPQDMPSAEFLIKHGIERVIVNAEDIQNDLAHILKRYSEHHITILLVESDNTLSELTIVKPSWFKSMRYRFKVTVGLCQNPAGGFGTRIPDQIEISSDSASGGSRYYSGLG